LPSVLAPVEHRRDLGVRLPRPGPIRRAGRGAHREDGRVRLLRDRPTLCDRVADEDDRARRRVDLGSVDDEPGATRDHDVQLLVAGRRLVVFGNDRLAGLVRGPRVDAERLHAEPLPDR
jgi:hypothetical protein